MKALRIIEIMWLIIAILAIIVGSYKSATEGLMVHRNYTLFIIAVIAIAMYFFRKKKRIFLEQNFKEKK